MRTRSPGHLATFDYLGPHRYSLTFCTHHRDRLFTATDRVDLTYGQILRAATGESGEIVVACFMPDHLHLLVEMKSDSSDALRFISRAKQLSGYHFKQRFERRLWQRYSYDRVLRDSEPTLVVARYLVANPVRAGLVTAPEDYAYTRSEKYTVREIVEAVQMM